MEILPIGMWEELQMLQIYPKSSGQRCGNSTHGPMGGVADATNLPKDLLGMCYILCTTGSSVKFVFSQETCHNFCLVFHVALIFMSIVGWFFGTWFF
jgi:hypothetical protein